MKRINRSSPGLKIRLSLSLILLLIVICWQDVVELTHINPRLLAVKYLWNSLFIALWLLMFSVIKQLINKYWWDGVVTRRSGRPVPALVKTISSALLLFVSATIIFTTVFDRSLTGVLAVGGGVSLIIGIALQNMIADVFSGLAINIDQPFRIGDFIHLNNRRLGDEEMIGKVVSINWRTTRLEKTDGTLVVIPNNLFSMMVLTNFSMPQADSRFELSYCIDFASDAERVLKILQAAVLSAPTILITPPPKVRVDRVDDKGVHYLIRYWIDPREGSPLRARHGVNSAVLRHLRFAGISLAYERNDIYFAPMPARQIDYSQNLEALVARVSLFTSLPPEGIKALSLSLKPYQFKVGEIIVKAGEAGDSMYIIAEGLLEVYLDLKVTNDNLCVAKMSPGEYFGEMSLITGDPRSATIVSAADGLIYEIEKKALEPLFQTYPALPESIAQTVSFRDVHRENIVAEAEQRIAIENSQRAAKDQLLQRMKRFFQL